MSLLAVKAYVVFEAVHLTSYLDFNSVEEDIGFPFLPAPINCHSSHGRLKALSSR